MPSGTLLSAKSEVITTKMPKFIILVRLPSTSSVSPMTHLQLRRVLQLESLVNGFVLLVDTLLGAHTMFFLVHNHLNVLLASTQNFTFLF